MRIIVTIRNCAAHFLGMLFVLGATSALAGQPAPLQIDKSEVVFDTTLGSFTVALDPEKAPATVENFLRYVDTGFYDGILFHRVIPNFMAQAGGFQSGLTRKNPFYAPIENESMNGLRNVRGTIAMARSRQPNSATAQFFVNVVHNFTLDARDGNPGYAVFGTVVDGMQVIDDIVDVSTASKKSMEDVPQEDIVILSARRKLVDSTQTHRNSTEEPFVPGVHYVVLDEPLSTGKNQTTEVVQAFAYGCPNCFAFDSLVQEWRAQQSGDVEFRRFPAVWNEPMAFFAQIYFTAEQLGVAELVHIPLYQAFLVEQEKLGTEDSLATWFAQYGIDSADFLQAFNSSAVQQRIQQAEAQTRAYNLGNVPQVIVNGKFAVDIARAGGRPQMLAVVNYLVNKENAASGGTKRP